LYANAVLNKNKKQRERCMLYGNRVEVREREREKEREREREVKKKKKKKKKKRMSMSCWLLVRQGKIYNTREGGQQLLVVYIVQQCSELI
jgi:hypothetical protein